METGRSTKWSGCKGAPNSSCAPKRQRQTTATPRAIERPQRRAQSGNEDRAHTSVPAVRSASASSTPPAVAAHKNDSAQHCCEAISRPPRRHRRRHQHSARRRLASPHPSIDRLHQGRMPPRRYGRKKLWCSPAIHADACVEDARPRRDYTARAARHHRPPPPSFSTCASKLYYRPTPSRGVAWRAAPPSLPARGPRSQAHSHGPPRGSQAQSDRQSENAACHVCKEEEEQGGGGPRTLTASRRGARRRRLGGGAGRAGRTDPPASTHYSQNNVTGGEGCPPGR